MSGNATMTTIHWPDVRHLERGVALVLGAMKRRGSADSATWTCDPASMRLIPLRGGLESASVARVAVSMGKGRRPRHVAFVAKCLHGDEVRESAVYRWLSNSACSDLTPRYFGFEADADGNHSLFLEALTPIARWPWSQIQHVSAAMSCLAILHQTSSLSEFKACVPDLDFETVLHRRSLATLSAFESAIAAGENWLRAFRPALIRVVESVSLLRRQLATAVALAPAVLHGDVHSGNLFVCRRGDRTQPVFADWARARCGSPLEDVSSWLQSLALWEPEVRRRHDTLLKRYFDVRGCGEVWSRSAREAYWLASASNTLAGSLEYYLEVMACPAAAVRQRHRARHVAHAWLRAIRRTYSLR